MWVLTCRAWSFEKRLALGAFRFHGLQIGIKRYFGIDSYLTAIGQLNNHVRSANAVAEQCLLLR